MFFKYPYTDLYNLNLDWIIQTVRELQEVVSPLEHGIVNSVNGMHGDVVITKAMLIQILENLVATFNGRTGDVVLTAEDVNATLIDITWTSDPGDTIADLTQAALDDLYQSGKRVLIFVNSQGVADRIYFLQYYDSHAQPQELATVASFNGRTGNVTLTAADVNGTLIANTWISDPGDTIADLTQTELDELYQSGKRILIFLDSQGIADRIYFFEYYGGHAHTVALAVVPTTRTVNNKPLNSNITINSSDVPSMAIPGTSSVETALMSLNISKVPTTRTVNGKALSTNITLNDEDIPSGVVSGQTTVEGVLTNLNQRTSSQAEQIQNLGPVNNLTSDSATSALSAAQGKALKALIDALPKWIVVDVQQEFSGQTSIFYTGCSVTIPANSVYVLYGTNFYMNAQPAFTGFSKSNDPSQNAYYINRTEENTNIATICGITGATAESFYLFAKYPNVTTNSCRIRGAYMALN